MRTYVLRGIVLVLVSLWPADGLAQSEALLQAYKQGVALYQAGRYGEATPIWVKVLELGEREFGLEPPEDRDPSQETRLAVRRPGPLCRRRAPLQARPDDLGEGPRAGASECRRQPQRPRRTVPPRPGPLRRRRAPLQARPGDLREGSRAAASVGPPPSSTTSRCSTTPRAATKTPSPSTSAPSRSGRRPSGRSIRTSHRAVKRLSILTPDRRAKLTPLSGTAEVVPVVNRGDPRGFV